MSSSDRADTLIESRPSLGDEVYERLLGDLITLRLPPGERLSVDGLARRFGVSQTPTRNALIRLVAEGLVTKKQFSGFSVAPLPSMERFEQIFEMRSLIEPRAARRAAEISDQEALLEIEKLGNRMRTLANEDIVGNCSRIVVADSEFHRAIAVACRNDLIRETLGRLFAQLHIFRLRLQPGVVQSVVDEHIEILEAIRDGEAEAAEAAMRRHVDAAFERIEPYLRGAI